MTLTKTKTAVEIVGFLILLVVVEWLSATVLGTRAFWPIMLYVAIYLGVRAMFFARKLRAAAPRSPQARQ